MTNFERWRVLTKKLSSPDSWIDFGFFFLISACLQRRVWYYGEGDDGSELYPNLYGCFVGPPGLGKGLVLSPVARMLKHHKYEKGSLVKTNIGSEKPPLFAVGADSITFEELLSDVADSIRFVPLPNTKNYIHTSYAFVLEELDSLFKRKTQDVINFLKNAYDCKPYDYKTKHQGKNILRNLCMCLLAGTQPDFLFDARKSGIFGQGFASRTLFLFEEKERLSNFHVTEKDDEQKACEKELLEYIKRLATVYGEIKYSQETYNFLEAWHRDRLVPSRVKAPPRLQEYLARKKVTMLKIAAAMHFGDSLDMVIPTETFVRAIKWLDDREANLEKGLGLTGRNELHGFQKRVHEWILSRGVAMEREVILAFSVDMNVVEIKQVLDTLVLTGALKESLVEKNQKRYSA